MAENKTKPTNFSVDAYINGIEEDGRRKDCKRLVQLIKEVSGEAPKMWGAGIVGFGNYHYRYQSGRQGDAPLIGFSSRKSDITLYLMLGCADFEPILSRLGKHKTGKGCLYLKRLADVDEVVLGELIGSCMEAIRLRHI